jgi:hypothetical protein
MSDSALRDLLALMTDGLQRSGVTSPTRAEVERGCMSPAEGVAEYREGSRARVRLRTRPGDRRREVNVDGALHSGEPADRAEAIEAVAAMFRG